MVLGARLGDAPAYTGTVTGTSETSPSRPGPCGAPSEPRPLPTRAAVLADVTSIARDRVGREGPVEPGMRLVEDLGLDSIRLLTLAVQVEDHFRICLDEEDEEEIETVGDLVETVLLKLAAKRRAAKGGEEKDPGDAPRGSTS